MGDIFDQIAAEAFASPTPTAAPAGDIYDQIAAQVYAEPAQPQGPTFADSLGNIGQSFARGVEGLIQINPMGGMQSQAIGQNLVEALSGQYLGPTQGEQLTTSRESVIGNPDYSKAGALERYAGAGAEMLPYAALGGGPMSAIMSGVGGEVSKDLGFDPIYGQLLGGAGYDAAKRGGSAFVNMFTKGGREKLAGNTLKRAVGPEGVDNILNYADDIEGATMAEVAKTPGAANLQMQLGKEVEQGNIIRDSLAKRESSRLDQLKALAPGSFEGITADVRGEVLRTGAQPFQETAGKMTRNAWEAASKAGGSIDVTDAKQVILSELEAMRGPLGFSKDAQKVIAAIVGNEGDEASSIVVRDWTKIRSAAGDVMATASANNRGTEARLMAIVRDQLDQAANKAVTTGLADSQGVALVKNAIDTTKKVEGVYGSGVAADIAKRSDYGTYRYAPSSLPQKVISSPESAKQFIKAYGKSPEMVGQARSSLIDTMAKKQPDTWVKFFNEKRPQFKALFGDDFLSVKKVMDNLASEQGVNQLAQKATGRGSITSQGQTVMSWLLDSTSVLRGVKRTAGAVGAGIGGMSSGGEAASILLGTVVGGSISKLAGLAENDIKNVLARAVVEPGFAAKLLSKPSPALIQDALGTVLRAAGMAEGQKAQSADRKVPNLENQGGQPLYQYLKESVSNLGPQNAEAQELAIAQPRKEPISNQSVDNPYNNLRPNPPATQAQSAKSVEPVAFIKQLPPLIQAVIKVESNGNAQAKSSAGAMGLMQLMPENVKTFGVSDPFHPVENVKAGMKLLSEELERFDDLKLALAAYNAGSPKVNRAIKAANSRDWAKVQKYLPQETREYISKVLRAQNEIETTLV